MINFALEASENAHHKNDVPVLFVLDEFHVLERTGVLKAEINSMFDRLKKQQAAERSNLRQQQFERGKDKTSVQTWARVLKETPEHEERKLSPSEKAEVRKLEAVFGSAAKEVFEKVKAERSREKREVKTRSRGRSRSRPRTPR